MFYFILCLFLLYVFHYYKNENEKQLLNEIVKKVNYDLDIELKKYHLFMELNSFNRKIIKLIQDLTNFKELQIINKDFNIFDISNSIESIRFEITRYNDYFLLSFEEEDVLLIENIIKHFSKKNIRNDKIILNSKFISKDSVFLETNVFFKKHTDIENIKDPNISIHSVLRYLQREKGRNDITPENLYIKLSSQEIKNIFLEIKILLKKVDFNRDQNVKLNKTLACIENGVIKTFKYLSKKDFIDYTIKSQDNVIKKRVEKKVIEFFKKELNAQTYLTKNGYVISNHLGGLNVNIDVNIDSKKNEWNINILNPKNVNISEILKNFENVKNEYYEVPNTHTKKQKIICSSLSLIKDSDLDKYIKIV